MRSWPAGYNVGVGCRINNLVVLDLDNHADGPDGRAVFADWQTQAGVTPLDTLSVLTPHGLHLYFLAPQHRWIASGSVVPGVDVRGPGRRSGGYVIGPGSVVAGHRYTAQNGAPIAPLPSWLARRLPGGTAR